MPRFSNTPFPRYQWEENRNKGGVRISSRTFTSRPTATSGRSREEAQGASCTHDTQKEAEKKGRHIARNDKTEFVLHGQQGQIRERDSYGSDPDSSKG